MRDEAVCPVNIPEDNRTHIAQLTDRLPLYRLPHHKSGGGGSSYNQKGQMSFMSVRRNLKC